MIGTSSTHHYHQEFSKKLHKEKGDIIKSFLKDFKVLDWSGRFYDGGMMPNIDFPLTWNSIIRSLHDRLLPFKNKIVIEQLKEKFGGLRVYFYTDGATKEERITIDSIISYYEGMVQGMYIVVDASGLK